MGKSEEKRRRKAAVAFGLLIILKGFFVGSFGMIMMALRGAHRCASFLGIYVEGVT